MRVFTLLTCLGIQTCAYALAILPADCRTSDTPIAYAHANSQQGQWAAKWPASDNTALRPPSRRPPPPLPSANDTIYETLAKDPRFSTVMRLINLNNATIDLLNSVSTNVTFFAPPNSAFPKQRHHNRISAHLYFREDAETLPSADYSDEYNPEGMLDLLDCDGSLDDEADEEKKRRFKKLVATLLSYHILPLDVSPRQLGQNSTFATNLTLPNNQLGDAAFRLRIGRTPYGAGLTVNVFSQITGPVIRTKNGHVYTINRPLLPPSAVFDQLFVAQRFFSVLTSALQRVGLHAQLNSSSDGVTIFAPTNRAFERLPPKLRAYLFSPWGTRALKRLLQFHIVPSHVVYTDYLLNISTETGVPSSAPYPTFALPLWPLDTADELRSQEGKVQPERTFNINIITSLRKLVAGVLSIHSSGHMQKGFADSSQWNLRPPHRRPSEPPIKSNVTLALPTLVAANATLTFEVIKFSPPRSNLQRILQHVRVNGVPVVFADGVAANGAFHAIDHILNPKRTYGIIGNGPQDEWEGWEKWLPTLADRA